MCIMAQPVVKIASTNIFVGYSGDRQITVYQMEVTLRGKGNAMILPVPAASASEIGMLDLSNDEGFFDKLAHLFVERSRGAKMGAAAAPHDSLEVIQVGSYDVSIASNIDEISKANSEVFALSPETSEVLSKHYSEGYAFVIAQIREGGKIHPLAYTSPRRERLFIPTRHEHGDGDSVRPKWDHEIYTQASREPATPPHVGKLRGEYRAAATGTYAKHLLGDFRERLERKGSPLSAFIDPSQALYRWRYRGPFYNIDLHA